MTRGPIEPYHARPLAAGGHVEAHGARFKLYHLNGAPEATVLDTLVAGARPEIAQMGDSNGLGFVILHTGSAGVTGNAFWWVQGSVLCQHHLRVPFGSAPLGPRPVVGYVWELEVIAREQSAWRRHMMDGAPQPGAYLDDWAGTQHAH
ncbi:hypothetical protein [Pseudaestuariivita sp.]|uniref:hypothetical protein n=1 Tax=Pseudaestuariivita sp. TaxID=2211669 RepID=UPI0040580714